MRATRSLVALAVTLAGCTFTGIADYDVSDCDPTQTLANDVCNRLNTANLSCQRYQCDAQTKRCVLSTLDADRDGDPPIACGGTDCDDSDPKRSGKQIEICDGIDNDCNGVTDDGVLVPSSTVAAVATFGDRNPSTPDLRIASEDNKDTYATYVSGGTACVHGLLLGGDNGDAGCTPVLAGTDAADAGADGGAQVRQPDLTSIGTVRESTTGIAFLRSPDDTCATERLAYWNLASGVAVDADCGAALPTLASFPLEAEGLIAFYDARVADRSDPVNECATLAPAPLKLRWIDGPTQTANATTSAAANLGSALSTRPPALLAVDGGSAVLLASPLDDSAGLWALTSDGQIVPLVASIPGFVGVRSVGLASGSDGSTTRLAIIGELGCRPQQGLQMVIAKFDPLSASLVDLADPFAQVTIVANPAPAVSAPAVAWMSGVNEWWVTWVDQRNKAMLRRVAADGTSAEPAIEIGDAELAAPAYGDLTGGIASTGSTASGVYLVHPDGSAVDRVALVCKH